MEEAPQAIEPSWAKVVLFLKLGRVALPRE